MKKLLDNEVRIEWLKPMRVLSSFIKESYIEDGFYYTSDAKGFYKWIDANLPISMPGSHDVFDFQNTFIRNKYQPAAMKKISDDFINTTPFVDYIFGGGLFAMLYAYEDENIGIQHNRLKDYLDKSTTYEIDYLPNGNQRHESLGEPVISPNISRNRLALYIPVKIRSYNTPQVKGNFDKYVNSPNIGRIEPSIETFEYLMSKLQNKNK
jgi:hypothetical protein